MQKTRKKKRPPKHVLALPHLEQSKAAVLNSLTSKSGLVAWHCSEPSLALNRSVVLR